jgi:16S rRNA C1402 (ribose-2'-O) methylase RsmI
VIAPGATAMMVALSSSGLPSKYSLIELSGVC